MSRGPHRPRSGIDPVLRSRARRRALQAIYAWQISGGNCQQLIAQFAHEQAHEVADLEYFEALVRGVLGERAGLDQALALQRAEQIDIGDRRGGFQHVRNQGIARHCRNRLRGKHLDRTGDASDGAVPRRRHAC